MKLKLWDRNLALQSFSMTSSLSVCLTLRDDVLFGSFTGTARFGELVINGSGGSDSSKSSVRMTYNSLEVQRSKNKS
jgi:hypothetical protein